MLSIQNLVKKYHKFIAVDHVSFTVEPGSVAIILGPNGAGKSTTIKSIVGLLRFEGDITIDDISNKEKIAKQRLAYIPEVPSMFPLLTVREHLIYFLKAYNKTVDDIKIDELLDRFDLLDKQTKLGNELSKGMMQKVSICCALIVDPEVIIFDEPMVGLDPKAIKELKAMILTLKSAGKIILISTHMLEMVETLWDRVILMDLGKLVGIYDKDKLEDKDLEVLFFANTGEDHE